MFRLWSRIFQDTHMLQDIVIEDASDDTRTHKIFRALEESARAFDVSTPIWLEKNKNEFLRFSRTRFTADNFMEPISFDYLEIRMIEED